jgi:guanine nucleotide-binding protein subunit alpha
MLFLNKKDLLAEKIMNSNIVDQPPFSDYAGEPRNFDDGVLYFFQNFKDYRVDQEDIYQYTHVTCATDTNNMEFILELVRTILMTQSLMNSGFLGS